MGNLAGAARKTVFDSLKLKKDEQFLLVTDQPKLEIAEVEGHGDTATEISTVTLLG